MVLGHGANQEETSPALATLVNQYASILAAQVLTDYHLRCPAEPSLQSQASPSLPDCRRNGPRFQRASAICEVQPSPVRGVI